MNVQRLHNEMQPLTIRSRQHGQKDGMKEKIAQDNYEESARDIRSKLVPNYMRTSQADKN